MYYPLIYQNALFGPSVFFLSSLRAFTVLSIHGGMPFFDKKHSYLLYTTRPYVSNSFFTKFLHFFP